MVKDGAIIDEMNDTASFKASSSSSLNSNDSDDETVPPEIREVKKSIREKRNLIRQQIADLIQAKATNERLETTLEYQKQQKLKTGFNNN